MNKKILIGSMLVLTLLLLMPSIPAIQQKTITDDTYHNTLEKIDFIDIKNIRESNLIKHSILYEIVIFLAKIRLLHLVILWEIAVDVIDYPPYFEAKMPLLFFYCVWILNTLEYWCAFWNHKSDTFGWDWGDIAETVIKWYEDNFEREI